MCVCVPIFWPLFFGRGVMEVMDFFPPEGYVCVLGIAVSTINGTVTVVDLHIYVPPTPCLQSMSQSPKGNPKGHKDAEAAAAQAFQLHLSAC